MSDGWEDAPSSNGGWEDVPTTRISSGWEDPPVAKESPELLDFLMGAPRKGMPESKLAKAARVGVGGVETIANLATGLGSYIPALAGAANAGAGQLGRILSGGNPAELRGPGQAFEDISRKLTYQPRTPIGEAGAELTGELMNRYAIPLMGHAGAFPSIPERPKAPIVSEVNPKFKGLDNLDQSKQIPTQPELPINKGQMELPDQGSQAPQYGVKQGQGHWVTDEHGIPIRVDLSMEARNLENPLQRNLWGDELAPKSSQEGKPLTQAIDEMLPEQRRVALDSELRGDLPASGELQAAMAEANPPHPAAPRGEFSTTPEGLRYGDQARPGFEPNSPLPTRRLGEVVKEVQENQGSIIVDGPGRTQKGILNMDIFDPAFSAVKDIANNIRLVFHGDEAAPHIFAYKDGVEVGQLKLQSERIVPDEKGNLQASWVDTAGAKGTGLAREMYKFAAEKGNDVVPAQVQTRDGKSMWKRFELDGVSKNQVIPRSQRGAVDFSWLLPDRYLKNVDRYGSDLKYPFHTRSGLRLGGFTDPKRTTFKGYDKNGNEVTIRAEYLQPSDILDSSGIRQKTVEAIRDGLATSITVPKNQRGALDFKEIADAARKAVDTFTKGVHEAGTINIKHLTSKEEYLSKNIPGMKEAIDKNIPASDPPIKIAQDALAHGQDIPKMQLSANFQSGLELTASKYRDHPLLLGSGRILNESVKKTELQVRQIAQPILDKFSLLDKTERIELSELFKREMFNEKRYTPEELQNAGFSKRQVDSYDMMRAAHDAVYAKTNESRATLGKDPITKGNAYLASMRNGDWQFSVLDKHGKPAWFVREVTKADAIAAINHLKKNFSDTLDLSKTEPTFRKGTSNYHPDMPRDVMGAYQDMLRYFTDNPELSASIKDSMQNFLEQKGYNTLNHKHHFMEKVNVRGFEGDKPWLSDKDNANALMKAQADYLKSAIQWSHTQEAAAKFKELLSNKELLEAQPNAVDFVKKIVANQFGISKSVFRGIENALAELLPAMHGYNPLTMQMGRSTSSLYKGVNGIKTALYLQLLGLNLSHAIATPLQSLFTTPAQHRLLTTQGFKHNVAKTTLLATSDFFAGMAKHFADSISGKDLPVPMSELGSKALKYAEDNGIIEKNVFNESVELGSNPVGTMAKKVLGSTIAVPEKATRLATFLGFAHHLESSGKFKNQMEMFRRAEELTDRSLTSFRRPDRPLIVDKFGATGSLAYTFKSYLFNEFNQLSQLSREASRGTISPLVSHLGMMALVGGALSLPLVNEMDGMWNVLKDFVSEHMPEHYNSVKGNGLKASIIEHFPDTASYGSASTITGQALQSRFGTDVVDPEQPLKNLFPMGQDIKEAVAGLGALTHPNKTSLTEAMYQQMPALVKGQMENRMDIFKGPQQPGGQVAINPNNLLEHRAIDHLRTPSDIRSRQLGMISLPEAKDRQTGYINSQESKRIKQATDSLARNMFDAVIRKDPSDIKMEAQKYLELNPNGADLQKEMIKRIDSYAFTPTEKSLIKANTYQEIMNVMRLRNTRNANKF